jgi:ABC-type antimicrobial peptide transport system permease subunit
VDPEVPVDRVDPMTASVAESLARQRFYALLLGIFSGAALLLAAAGVYGLFSYAVSRRTREFGIRIALGADRERVARLVLARASALATIGILIGLAGALAAARTLRSLLFEVGTADPLALVGAGLLLGATSLAASWIPARRATKVDPLVALRSE